MSRETVQTILPAPEATDAFATRLAPHLQAGDVLLLEGPVGAGKTAFARALITALRISADLPPEDVPSPTFTLVQTYEAGTFEIWHADLYRLSDPQEVVELGLDDAFESALCLIEWPDRLGELRPDRAVTLRFSLPPEGGRRLELLGSGRAASRIAAQFDRAAA